MSDLKLSIAVLVSYIIFVLGIANIDAFQESVIDFDPVFFLLVALIVFSELVVTGNLISAGVRVSYYMVISFWVGVYLLLWVFYFGNSRPLQVQIIQLLLVAISAGLAYDVGKRIGRVDRTLEGLLSSVYPNRARNLQDARDLIDGEITRSRRYHHPLTVLAINLNKQESTSQETPAYYKALEKDMLERLAVAKIGQILSDYARNTDMVLRDRDGSFILICPETDNKNMSILANRINGAVLKSLDVDIHWGSASFPDEAITFDDLVYMAKDRLLNKDS